MRYRVVLNDPNQPMVMSETVEVEVDREPDRTSDPEFIIFTRDGAQVGLFRREQVQAVYEVSSPVHSGTLNSRGDRDR